MLSGVLNLEGQDTEEHEVSVGTYLYLVLGEQMHIENMPQVNTLLIQRIIEGEEPL